MRLLVDVLEGAHKGSYQVSASMGVRRCRRKQTQPRERSFSISKAISMARRCLSGW